MRILAGLCCLIMVLGAASIAAPQPIQRSTLADQTGVEVTVYNQNMGLVKETRKLNLPEGRGELRFTDVAAHIMPVTVHVESLGDPKGFTILEQNYEYDLINATKLLDKYVGKKIKVIDWNRYHDRKEVVDAILLSNNKGQIFKINGEIYLGYPGVRVLPELPENLIAKPTLTWLFDNTGKNPRSLEVSYLTNNINWKADYVVVLNKDDSLADISAWVTIDNKSGATYKQATLKLVAGEVQRVKEHLPRRALEMAAAPRAKARGFQEQAFFEYHLYNLKRKTTIKDRQTKQIRLLQAYNVKVQKEFIVQGIKSYFTRRYEVRKPKQPVDVYIKFKNSKENNLGMPLPTGIMRLYKEDQFRSQLFIGEDRIDHTPRNEEVKLKIGQAFDVVAERTQKSYQRLAKNLHESEWEVVVRNHKAEAVNVGIIEPLFGNWKVISSSQPYKKINAFTIRFDVNVPKDGEVKVTYKVRGRDHITRRGTAVS
ncbi:MAG: DUF4139 domain-containing protein [Deltaproteobacteria bacterium]